MMVRSWLIGALAITVLILSVMLFQQSKVTDELQREIYHAFEVKE
jgi:hypothetical protein